MCLDDAETDWEEAAELIATSYCLIAPKRLSKKVTEPLCSTVTSLRGAPR